MPEPRVTRGATTSPVYRVAGQKSRWMFPNPKLTAEDCRTLKNVSLTERGTAQTRLGYEKYDSVQYADPIVGLWHGSFADYGDHTVVVTTKGIYTDSGTTQVNITGSALTGTSNDAVRFVMLEKSLVMNNGVDQLQVWTGDDSTPTPAAALTGMPWTKCEDVMTHQNLLVVMGTTEGSLCPTRIRWCDINRTTFEVDITNWPAANRYEIYDGGPAIIGGVDCWGKAMIFKKDGLYPGGIEYDTLGHLSWRLDKPIRGFTPLSKHSIIARPEFLVVAAREGIVVFDQDMQMRTVNSDDYTQWVDFNRSRMEYVYAYIREGEHQYRLLVSSGTNANGHDQVVVWDWDTGAIWLEEMADTMCCAVSAAGVANVDVFNEIDLLGGYNGWVYKGNTGTIRKDDGTDISWDIYMHPNALGYVGKRKHVLNFRTLYRPDIAPLISAVVTTQKSTLRLYIDEDPTDYIEVDFYTQGIYTWNSEIRWNDGVHKWNDFNWVMHVDTWVGRICETITPRWYGNIPIAFEGCQIEFILLED